MQLLLPSVPGEVEIQQAQEQFGHFDTQVLKSHKIGSMTWCATSQRLRTGEKHIGYLFETCAGLDALCIPQIRHQHWAFCAIIYTQKLGFSDSPL